jgi:hypothetical protein
MAASFFRIACSVRVSIVSANLNEGLQQTGVALASSLVPVKIGWLGSAISSICLASSPAAWRLGSGLCRALSASAQTSAAGQSSQGTVVILFDDFGDDAGTNGAAAFADSEA